MATHDPMLTGLFRDRDSAERAYQSISDRGYTRDDVNLVMSDETRKRHFAGSADGRETELGTKAAEGAGIGGAIGGSLGAIAARSLRSARRSRCLVWAWSSPARWRRRSPARARARRRAASSAR